MAFYLDVLSVPIGVFFGVGVCLNLFVIFPGQTGTATSSPAIKTSSQSNMNIVNVMLWMKRNAYEDSTIKKAVLRKSEG